MRINKVIFASEQLAYRMLRLLIIAEAGRKLIAELFHDVGTDAVPAVFCKLRHPRLHGFIVHAGKIEEQPFEVAGNKDIH